MATTPPTQSLPEGTVVAGVPADLISTATRISFDTIGVGTGASPVLLFETTESIAVFDIESGEVTTTVPIPDVPQINDVDVTADAIWVTDHDNHAVLRLDAETGEIDARIEIEGRAVSLTETDEGVWAGSGHVTLESVALIDPDTNEVSRKLVVGAYPTYALGSLWFGRNELRVDPEVRRVDPVTGDVLASIRIRTEQGCYVGGSFPEVVWSWCLDLNRDTEPTRLDLDANATVATVELGAGATLLGVADGSSWFEAGYSEAPGIDYPTLLVRIDNATNQIDRIYQNDRLVTMANGSLWAVDRDAGELRRLELAGL